MHTHTTYPIPRTLLQIAGLFSLASLGPAQGTGPMLAIQKSHTGNFSQGQQVQRTP